MKTRFVNKIFCLALLNITFGVGCVFQSDVVPDNFSETEATLGTKTKTLKLLNTLPPPPRLINVSVYEFADYTGQNKPSDGIEYSRAVTQGGLSILKKALIDAGKHSWFRVLERGGLNNLLQERKIIRAMRSEYGSKELSGLGPLLYAGMLLEGGIISYESNVMTGGIGAKYLGIGGSTQYSRDVVTIYLRAVSVKTGEVLVSVNSSKTVFSQKIQGGAFKFVSYDELLESEAGVSFNEPPQLAVRQAIELGVYSLVMEGYRTGLWRFKDTNKGDKLLSKYIEVYKPIGSDTDAKAKYKVATSQQGLSKNKLTKSSTQTKEKLANIASSDKTLKPVFQDRASGAFTADEFQQKNAIPASKKVEVENNLVSSSLKSKGNQKKPKAKRYPGGINPAVSVEQINPGWYAQVVKSRSIGSAEKKIISSLKDAGLPTVVEELPSSDNIKQKEYRVLIGPYSNRDHVTSISNSFGFMVFYYGGAEIASETGS